MLGAVMASIAAPTLTGRVGAELFPVLVDLHLTNCERDGAARCRWRLEMPFAALSRRAASVSSRKRI